MSLPKFLLESRICNKDTCEIKRKLDQYEDPDDLTLFYMWLDEKAKDKMKQLQEENKRLKEIIKENTILVKDENGNYQELNINPLSLQDRIKELEQINEEHCKINGELREENEILTQARYSLDRVDLEQRIDKAIDYNEKVLKENWYGGNEKENATKTINILQGSDE